MVIAGTSPGAAYRPGDLVLVLCAQSIMSMMFGVVARRLRRKTVGPPALALGTYALCLGCSVLGVPHLCLVVREVCTLHGQGEPQPPTTTTWAMTLERRYTTLEGLLHGVIQRRYTLTARRI